ncbi:carbohydrate ABC transporter permease [Paenibacillus abyssi]|uniref:ABC transporter permease n=1 Tax=Paenibacillus abyssi TaxID=1340531 RepID=A0A917CXV0_9BACL|nr:sugar ABC transporter permease [Paenibacillus abyssi]GGG00840.1 ABC transporter permease [Paenibacillus abyssi]
MTSNKRIEPWLFVLPALLVFLFTVIVPIIWSFTYSLYEWNGIGDKRFIGIDNYTRMLTDNVFITSFKNNLIFTGLGTVVQIVIGMTMAVILTSITKFRNFIKVIYFIPCVISSMAISQIFSKMLSINPEGVVNATLGAVGLDSLKAAFLSDPNLTLIIVTLVDAYKFCAIYMVIYYAAFLAISNDIIEASVIDGCNWWQQYIYMRFPLIKGIFFITVVMLVSGTLKGFDVPYILTNGGPGASSELVSTYMYKVAFNSVNYGYGSAIAVFLVIECLLIVTLIRKLISKVDVEA